jgi:hypothetical protein
MSFPPATEMFQFAGFASPAYGFSRGYRLRGGLPHSEIPGSPIARISPGLVAACHVLHRLSVPRHPPDALTSRFTPHPTAKITVRPEGSPDAGPGEPSGEQCPGETRGPPWAGNSLSWRGLQSPAILKTLSGSPTHRPLARATDRSRLGHNSLIHICPSTTPPAVPSRRDRPRARSASCRVGHVGVVRGAPARLSANPLSAKLRFACRAAKAALSPVVEVIGLEPTPSCLQSRRSPS